MIGIIMSNLHDIVDKYLKITTTIIIIHVDGRVVWASPSVEKLFRTNPVGKRILDYVHHDFRELIQHRVNSIIRERDFFKEIEIKYIDQQGKTLYISTSGVYINYNGDDAILGVGRDNTELRETEHILIEAIKGILSEKEGLFLDLAARGLSRPEIARAMNTTNKTIDTYRERIKEKLKFDSDKLRGLIDYIRIKNFYSE